MGSEELGRLLHLQPQIEPALPQAARERQTARKTRARVNAQLTGSELKKCASLDNAGRSLLERSAERLHLSARGFHRVIRVARTIADLAGADFIALDHLGEALQYRFVEDASGSLPNQRRR